MTKPVWQWRESDLALTLLMPGLGHLVRGFRGKATLLFAFLAVQGATLGLAVSKHRLAWLAGPSKYWLSTCVMFVVLLGIWVFAQFDLWRSIRRMAEASSVLSYWQMAGRRFVRDPKGIVGLLIILCVLHVALFAPFFVREDPLKMDLVNFLAGPSAQHPLGQDNFGRDVLDRLIYGARVALGIGAVATLLNMLFGGALGLLSGYFRGVSDAVIMRLLEIINSIPFLVLALLVISLWGSSVVSLMLVLGIFGLGPARIIRSEVLSVRETDYVLSAKAVGTSTGRIILRYVLPNAIASLLVVTTMSIGVNIIVVAGLSFLGFGVRPPIPSWGAMLQQAQEFMRTAWWMAVYPGLCIIVTVFGFNILGDSLRDVLDPRLR
jgi:peptide/nickel transport system permease protein